MRNLPNTKQNGNVISFGPFRLFLTERRLEKEGIPVRVGSRALDILLVLARRGSQLVSKSDLIAEVWPNIAVEEVSLRVHIAALRKALGDGEGARYVLNVSGRGYCLAGATPHSSIPSTASKRNSDALLPPAQTLIVGRDVDVGVVCEKVVSRRFVTIVGPGGIGKTTVAISAAHRLSSELDVDVVFVDLGPVAKASLVPTVLASALGLTTNSENTVQTLLNSLRERVLLLVIDSCEHLVQTVATLAEQITRETSNIYLLATSRESLRAEGEHIYRLLPLGYPMPDVASTVSEALAFPAVRLLIDRIAAYGSRYEFGEADVVTVCEICRRLDGIPLAIELAAGCAEAYGIRETARLLDNRFRLLWHGRRTALPRHQTLNSTLDWSYNLLSDFERMVLRRLSVFRGTFSLDAAQSVALSNVVDRDAVLQVIGNLASKSFLIIVAGKSGTLYRLLDTTRAYLCQKLDEAAEGSESARRHAFYFRELLENQLLRSALTPSERLGLFKESLSNVRAALEWSFSSGGDAEVATALAAASAPYFLELSLLTECGMWMERSISILDDARRGTGRELTLYAALGISLMFTQGNNEQALYANLRALSLAEELDEPYLKLRMLGQLNMFNHRAGSFGAALALAKRAGVISRTISDPAGRAMADWMLCVSYHLVGNQASARRHCEETLIAPSVPKGLDVIRFGYEHRIRALSASARILWLCGCSDQARAIAEYAISEAERFGSGPYLCLSLCYTSAVFMWSGDWPSAEAAVERLIAEATKHSLLPYLSDGLGLRGELHLRTGRPLEGVRLLRDWLQKPPANRSQILSTVFASSLAEGLSMLGDFAHALSVISGAIAEVDQIGEWYLLPEMLRIKGSILASAGPSKSAAVEECFVRSMAIARRQSAAAWELRTAISFAELKRKRGRFVSAREVLQPAYNRVTEGFTTLDPRAAKSLLSELEMRRAETVKTVDRP